MSNKDTILERARRIAELAKRGVDGERVNAERLLADFLAKHGLQVEDLEQEDVKEYRFDVTADEWELRMVRQCIASSLVDAKVYSYSRNSDDVVVALSCEMTASQHAEACMKIAVMLPLLKEELMTFMIGFIHANGLAARVTEKVELDEEQRARMQRASGMAMFAKRGHVRKGIGDGN